MVSSGIFPGGTTVMNWDRDDLVKIQSQTILPMFPIHTEAKLLAVNEINYSNQPGPFL